MIYSRGLHQPDSSDLCIINRYIRFRLRARSRSTRASCCPDSARTHAYTHARVAATCRSAAHCAAADFGGTPRPRRERAVRRLPRRALASGPAASRPAWSIRYKSACRVPPSSRGVSARWKDALRQNDACRAPRLGHPRARGGRRGRRRKEWKITAHEERVCRCCRSEVIFCMSPIWSIRRTHRPSKMLPELP